MGAAPGSFPAPGFFNYGEWHGTPSTTRPVAPDRANPVPSSPLGKSWKSAWCPPLSDLNRPRWQSRRPLRQRSDLIQAGSTPITPDGGNGSPTGYTPQQIRTAYGINDIQFGSIAGDGSGQTIAIVDAYDDPGLVNTSSSNYSTSDLAEFDLTFGLPDPPSFTKVNQFGSTTNLPGTDPAGPGNGNGNWEYEEAMDVEWAHAIAPGANIILVEADSNSFGDLYHAIATAANLPGVSTVSMSWGSPEFSGETQLDSYFETPSGHQGVTFVAASGDGGSPGIDPAYSPNVVAAGGTSLTLTSDGTYQSEIGWYGSGGGVSSYEPEPAYQDGVQSTGYRTIPDVSFDADRIPGSRGLRLLRQHRRRPLERDGRHQPGRTLLGRPDRDRRPGPGRHGRDDARRPLADSARPLLAPIHRLPRHHDRIQRLLCRTGLRLCDRAGNPDRQPAGARPRILRTCPTSSS